MIEQRSALATLSVRLHLHLLHELPERLRDTVRHVRVVRAWSRMPYAPGDAHVLGIHEAKVDGHALATLTDVSGEHEIRFTCVVQNALGRQFQNDKPTPLCHIAAKPGLLMLGRIHG